jgi:hypothetical protein
MPIQFFTKKNIATEKPFKIRARHHQKTNSQKEKQQGSLHFRA